MSISVGIRSWEASYTFFFYLVRPFVETPRPDQNEQFKETKKSPSTDTRPTLTESSSQQNILLASKVNLVYFMIYVNFLPLISGIDL